MSLDRLSAQQEWKAHWPLVLAAMLGFSLSTVKAHALGLFMDPMNDELGWSRTEISIGFTLAAVIPIFLSPVVGALIDKWGTRRLAIAGVTLTTLAVASFGFVNTVGQWIAMWLVYAVVALGVKLTVWTAAVSSVFAAGRGLALACTISGTALTAILIPPVAYWAIVHFGWRLAYGIIAVGWAVPTMVLILLFMFDRRDRARVLARTAPQAPQDPLDIPGLTIAEALRSAALWRIGLSTLIVITLAGSLIVHQVPILVDAGVSREKAAMLASLAGFAGFLGKMVTGWLMDRMHAAKISGLTFGATAIGFAMLLEPFRSPVVIVLAMIIVGYAGGAKLQVTAYLTTAYGGLRNFGKIFGVMASLIALGAGLGPLLASAAYDLSGSYAPFLIGGIPGFLLSAVLIFGLGPYPDGDVARAASDRKLAV